MTSRECAVDDSRRRLTGKAEKNMCLGTGRLDDQCLATHDAVALLACLEMFWPDAQLDRLSAADLARGGKPDAGTVGETRAWSAILRIDHSIEKIHRR